VAASALKPDIVEKRRKKEKILNYTWMCMRRLSEVLQKHRTRVSV